MATDDQHAQAPASTARPQPAGGGPWRRFAARHLFDYNAKATRLWLGIVLAGAMAASLAVAALAHHPDPQWGALVATTFLVVVMAAFPLHIPRTKYSISVADVFLFALLALHGA
jgi:hypothetical protein